VECTKRNNVIKNILRRHILEEILSTVGITKENHINLNWIVDQVLMSGLIDHTKKVVYTILS
jgi:hypothetical protein